MKIRHHSNKKGEGNSLNTSLVYVVKFFCRKTAKPMQNLEAEEDSDFSHRYFCKDRPGVSMPWHLEGLPPTLSDTFQLRIQQSFQSLCISKLAALTEPHLDYSSCLRGNTGAINAEDESIPWEIVEKKLSAPIRPHQVPIILFNYIQGARGETADDCRESTQAITAKSRGRSV